MRRNPFYQRVTGILNYLFYAKNQPDDFREKLVFDQIS
jgi:hypothetical protein